MLLLLLLFFAVFDICAQAGTPGKQGSTENLQSIREKYGDDDDDG